MNKMTRRLKSILIVLAFFALTLGCQRNHLGKVYNSKVVEILLNIHADSINQIYKTHRIPRFLSDPQFEWEHAGFSISVHNPLPLRALILEKVKNCISLKIILDLKNPEHLVKPTLELNFRVIDMDKSFYELCERRYRELRCGD